METILYAIPLLATAIIVPGIMTLININSETTIVKDTVRLSPIILILGIVSSVLIIIMFFGAIFTGSSLWSLALICVFLILGSSLIIAYLNCIIKFDSNGFTSKNFFGIKHRYLYIDISGITEGPDTILYLGKKKIRIDQMAYGKKEFLKAAKKAIMLENGGIPYTIPRVKSKLFNGNIANPIEFIVIFILFELLAIGLSCWSFFGFPLPNESNSFSYTMTFQKSTIEGNDLLINCTETNTQFIINNYKDVMPKYNEFLNNIQSGDKISITADEKYEVKSSDSNKIELYSVTSHNVNYLSFSEVYENAKFNKRDVVFMCLGMAILWTIYIIISIRVMNNPQNYTRSFVKWFVKPEYVLCKMKDDQKPIHHKKRK